MTHEKEQLNITRSKYRLPLLARIHKFYTGKFDQYDIIQHACNCGIQSHPHTKTTYVKLKPQEKPLIKCKKIIQQTTSIRAHNLYRTTTNRNTLTVINKHTS